MADGVEPKTYQFSWNGRNKYLDAYTYSEARRKFQERYGFWPSEELVKIIIVGESPDNSEPKPRRPKSERDAIRALMKTLGVNYTTALREYEHRKEQTTDDNS